MPHRTRILVVGWSGHAVGRGVIAALGGVEGDRVEVPRHLHGLGEPPVNDHDRAGRRREGWLCLTLADLIASDEAAFEAMQRRPLKRMKP